MKEIRIIPKIGDHVYFIDHNGGIRSGFVMEISKRIDTTPEHLKKSSVFEYTEIYVLKLETDDGDFEEQRVFDEAIKAFIVTTLNKALEISEKVINDKYRGGLS